MRRKPFFILIVFTAIAVLLGSATILHAQGGATSPSANLKRLSPAKAKRVISKRSRQTIVALKHKDLQKLALLSHPDYGVRFTPYNYVMLESNLVFKREKLVGLSSDDTKYVWGEFDGSGYPINFTFAQYYRRFIYDIDFASAPTVTYNKAKSITIAEHDNAFLSYPGSIIVEYYRPGTKRYDGMNWRSLRLVFQQKDGAWYLVGILHDEWTI